MCGLSGIFAYASGAEPLHPKRLEAMSSAQSQRGPDGQGMWIAPDQRLGLAHRRLAILDVQDTGHQPMTSVDGNLQIVFNGEIYNFQALKSQMQADGAVFRSRSDTEVLLHLWDRFGPDMVSHLRGMFAFVLWDERRQCLFAARDPMGVKPLYYHDDGSTLYIASQVKALKSALATTTPCPAGLVGFFLLGSVPEPFTAHEEIRSLPAGSALLCHRDARPQLRSYWSMAQCIQKLTESPPPLQPLADLLNDSVSHHLVSDVPVSLFLSAGIDSGVLAALANQTNHPPLTAFTLGFDEFQGLDKDEAPLAADVAAHYGLAHHVYRLSKQEYFQEIPTFLKAMDQPSIDGINTYFIAKAAKQAGMKVALSGLGADELFAGYGAFASIPKCLALTKPLSNIPLLGKALRRLGLMILPSSLPSKSVGLVEYGSNVADAYLLRRCLFAPWELSEVLDPETLRQGWEQLAIQPSLRALETATPNTRLEISLMESCFYMRNQLLRDADWAGMAHGVEIRVPYVDVSVLEGIIAHVLAGNATGKAELAATPAHPLPPQIINRRKTGFNVPFNTWQNMTMKEYALFILRS